MNTHSHPFKSGILIFVSLLFIFQPLAVFAAEAPAPSSYQLAQELTLDPLQGPDLERLEQEKMKLLSMKAHPETAMVFSLVPGAGHMYAGQTQRGAWVMGGFAATLVLAFLGSYVLSSIDSDVARSAAVITNVAPTSAYIAWSATDAYYQTQLKNDMIDNKIKEMTLKQKENGYYSNLLQIHF